MNEQLKIGLKQTSVFINAWGKKRLAVCFDLLVTSVAFQSGL